MERFFFAGVAAVAFMFSWDICVAEKMPPPGKAYDFWRCVQTPTGNGQKNCVEIRDHAETGRSSTGNRSVWKKPVFCDPAVNANVARRMLANAEKAAQDASLTYGSPGYEMYPGVGYYKVHTEKKTWTEAKQICADEGVNTHLAIPSTAAEYNAIANMSKTFLPADMSGMYLGMIYSKAEGNYLTMFDQPLCTLPRVLWFPGEPSAGKDSDKCLGLARNQGNLLADFSCDSKLPFICERVLPGRISGGKS